MKAYNHKTKTINIRIDKDLDNKLQHYAEAQRVTVSQLTRNLLEEYFCDSTFVSGDKELATV
jgi:predicted transcriptional regulator